MFSIGIRNGSVCTWSRMSNSTSCFASVADHGVAQVVVGGSKRQARHPRPESRVVERNEYCIACPSPSRYGTQLKYSPSSGLVCVFVHSSCMMASRMCGSPEVEEVEERRVPELQCWSCALARVSGVTKVGVETPNRSCVNCSSSRSFGPGTPMQLDAHAHEADVVDVRRHVRAGAREADPGAVRAFGSAKIPRRMCSGRSSRTVNSPRTMPCVLVFPPRSKWPGFQSPRICAVKVVMMSSRWASSSGCARSSASASPSSDALAVDERRDELGRSGRGGGDRGRAGRTGRTAAPRGCPTINTRAIQSSRRFPVSGGGVPAPGPAGSRPAGPLTGRPAAGSH